MKGLGFFDKLIFTINSLLAFLLLLSYLLPFIPPKSFSTLSVLSLGVPFLIILNVLFLVFWLFRLKKQLFLSLFVLVLGWNYINSLYKFSSSKHIESDDNFSVMSFNVRQFNLFEWLSSKTVKEDIIQLIESEQPDILCLQESPRGDKVVLEGYNQFNATYVSNVRGGLAIYSKFPIISSGSLEFPNTNNNAIFVDIVKTKDTLRVYNIHLQSSKIDTKVEALKKESSENLLKRIGITFKTQQEQSELVLDHKNKCPYKTIIAGDFNNTAYSYVYNQLKRDLVDTFEEAGNGFGKTYNFKFFPVRIDFILVDEAFTVNGYKSFENELSDHFPIKATLKLH
ncbi:endonuclease [Winogradskyella aurantia]|uniref:Endonuclease n=1 Tax=Winogradskyella aurantia TaxID=1915063 RepID=A0A265UQL1_9FLAO|nr:endonuclease [Winogradskyella aurantia]